MEEPEVIIQHLANYFAGKEGDLRGKTIMITAGPTYEKIDPVRFIGNYSSGKMGFAIADECAARGAKVIMISGPVQQQLKYPVRWFPVESADQMYNAACSFFAEADAAILSAAVADFTPEQVADAKIKREKEGEMTLRLKPTKDIAACLGQMKKERQVLVGFALETNDEQHNAEDKLRRKNLDFIVLNSLNDKGAGFRYDTNKISIIDRESKTDFPLLLVAVALKSTAQELNCKFTVNYSQIQGTSTQVFTTLENALMEFINTRRWTQAQYEVNERIRCSMNLTVKEYNEADGRWKCELIVQSTRPVWQSGYQTVVFSFKDTDVAFNYREFDPLQLRDNVIDSNLTAVIAYYAYMIIGLDMDTMAPQGGTEVFRAAEDIVTAAQNLGETGWKAFDSSRNRYALVSDYLEDGMTPLRKLMYGYHRTGMDELSVNVTRARAVITSMLSGLKEAQQNKPMSALPGLFTEIKKDELINLYSRAAMKEKEEIYELLSSVNPSLTTEWEKIKQ